MNEEPKKKTSEDLLLTTEVIEYHGQEIPLNEEERKSWEKQSHEQKKSWANSIRKALRSEVVEWKEKDGVRYLEATEKGRKGFEKRMAKRKARVEHLVALNMATTTRATSKPKIKKVSNSSADQRKIRQRLKKFKYELRNTTWTGENREEKKNLEEKIVRLTEWLNPRIIKH